jgi:hypothetical protein
MLSAEWTVPIACIAVWAYFQTVTFPHLEKFSWDSAVYIEAAQNLLRGGGLMQRVVGGLEPHILEPLALWPPGYPVAIAAVSAFGLTAAEAGVAVSIAAAAMFVILQACVAVRLCPWPAALAVALGTTAMPPLYRIGASCLSDSLYLALSTGSLLLFLAYLDDPARRLRSLLGAGLLAAAAFATRNVGLALLLAELLTLIIMFAIGRVSLPAILVWGGAASALVVPVVARNLYVFGAMSPYDMPPSTLSLADNVYAAFASLRDDVLAFGSWGARLRLTHGVAAAAILGGIAVGLHVLGASRQGLKETLYRARREYLLIGYSVLFVAIVVAARTKYEWGEPIYWRYLFPVYWLLAICAAMLLVAGAQRSNRFLTIVTCSLLFGWCVLQFRAQAHSAAVLSERYATGVTNLFGERGVEFLSATVPADKVLLASEAYLLRITQNLNARKITSQPFSDAPYRRELTWEDVSRAAALGHLWGVVIVDPKTAAGGRYGEWIRQLVEDHTRFPNVERVYVDSPAVFFRFVER